MNSLPEKLFTAVLFLASGMCVARAGQPGQMTHDHVLLGMHFLHTQSDNNATACLQAVLLPSSNNTACKRAVAHFVDESAVLQRAAKPAAR